MMEHFRQVHLVAQHFAKQVEDMAMEYVELVNKIIEAEHSAREIAQEAQEKEASLDQDLARDTQRLREDYFARADRRIQMVEQAEERSAQESMARSDQKLSEALASVESAYRRNRDRWVEILFRRIVGEAHA